MGENYRCFSTGRNTVYD